MCTMVGGIATEGAGDLWHCMQKGICEIVDHRQQLVVLRDPRAVVVSTYYHMVQNGHFLPFDNVDDFVLAFLPTTCKWVTIRYFLFGKILANQSTLYWYEDAQANPTEWHQTFLSAAGLNLPRSVAETASATVQEGIFLGFPSKGIDRHEGGIVNVNRSFKEELKSSTLSELDDVLRMWLPPVLLAKIDVA